MPLTALALRHKCTEVKSKRLTQCAKLALGHLTRAPTVTFDQSAGLTYHLICVPFGYVFFKVPACQPGAGERLRCCRSGGVFYLGAKRLDNFIITW